MPTRHRWTKTELTHLNRVVGQSKTKTDGFKKVGAEMNLPWQTVRSTYFNRHIKDTPTPPVESAESIFRDMTDEDLGQFMTGLKDEVNRRAEMIDELRKIYSMA